MITHAYFSCVPKRVKPKLGDRKMIRGVLHERKLEKVHDIHGNPIGYNHTGGRPHYVWVPV